MENLKYISSNEITLYSDENPAKVSVERIDCELEQSHKMRGIYRKITIFNGSYCQQIVKNKHQKKTNYRIDLAYLYPLPVREHHLARKWAYVAIVLGLLSAILVSIGWYSGLIGSSMTYMAATVGSISSAAISLLLFAHNSYDKVIFKSQHGGVHLIELLNKYPDKESFREFIGKVIVYIKSAKKNKKLSPSKFLSGELKELRRLRDEAVISAESYEIAKVEIFHNESYQITDPRNL